MLAPNDFSLVEGCLVSACFRDPAGWRVCCGLEGTESESRKNSWETLPRTRLQWSNDSSSRRGGENGWTEMVADEIVAAETEAEAGETGGEWRESPWVLSTTEWKWTWSGGKEICKANSNVQKEKGQSKDMWDRKTEMHLIMHLLGSRGREGLGDTVRFWGSLER